MTKRLALIMISFLSKRKTNKIWTLFISLLFIAGCSGYVKTSVWTLKAGSNFELQVNTFKITQSKNIYSKYPNHFSQYLLNRFKDILEDKLAAKGLRTGNNPDIELRIIEFNLLHRELDSLKIEIYLQDKHLETITYRPLDLGGGVSYFKKTPSIKAASEKIAKKIMYMFNLN